MGILGRFLYVGALSRLGSFASRWVLGSQRSVGILSFGALDRLESFSKSLGLGR